MFSEFDSYLAPEFQVDYWYDEGIPIASGLLSHFDDRAWQDLLEQCTSRPPEWQVRCCETLDLVAHPISDQILIKLLAAGSDDVVIAAADSLRSKDNVRIPVEALERLRQLSARGSAPVRAVLSNLLAQLDG